MRFISNGDFLFPLTWPLYMQQQFYTWAYQKGAANPDGIIRMPGRLVDLLVFMIFNNVGFGYFYLLSSIVIVFLAFWAFARYFLEIRRTSIQLLGALLFALNPIFLGNLAKVGLVLAAAMLPLCFVVIKRGFERQRFRYFLLWILLLNISLIHPYTFLVNLMASTGYFMYKAWHSKKFVRSNIPKFLLVGVIAVLLNAYFILPQASMRTLSKNSLLSTISSKPVDYTALVDVSNTGDIFTGLSLSKNVLKDFEFYIPVLANVYFLGAFLIYALIFGIYLRVEKRMHAADKKRFMALLAIFLVLVLLATVHFLHIDSLIKFLIGMPGGWAFRSPLKWQLYIPLALCAMLVLVMQYVARPYKRRLLFGGFAFVFVLMNGFLIVDVYKKILTPRSITEFAALQQTDLEHKNILFVSSEKCVAYQQKNPRVTTELNQILISKYTQLKQVGQGDIDLVNVDSYDYVMDCQNGVKAMLAQNYNFSLKNTFAGDNFQLYKNTQSKAYISSSPQLFSLKAAEQTGAKHDFATDVLQTKPFHFTPVNSDNAALPTTDLQDAFENISFKNVYSGGVASDITPLHDGPQTLYLKNNGQTLYYSQTGTQLSFSTAPQKGFQKLAPKDDISHIDIDAGTGKNLHITYSDPTYRYQNSFPNASLEDGAWQKKVGDCYAYDDIPSKLNMKLSRETKTDGKQSLELQANGHIACTGPDKVAVKGGQSYLLGFDYQNVGGQYAGYFVGFDDPDSTFVSGRIRSSSMDGWQTFTKSITAPKGAKHMQILVYAYPNNSGAKPGIARYDNFKLAAIPAVQDRLYLVRKSTEQLRAPNITYDSIDPTKTSVHVSVAQTPFYLNTAESYSPQWQLQADTPSARSWWPFAKTVAVNEKQHLNIDGSKNAWYVDPVAFCQNAEQSCTRNADGSYDIRLIMAFAPQRWFHVGALLSGITALGVVVYFVRDMRRDKQRERVWQWRR